MSENLDSAVVNSESAASGDIDAQLTQMQASEAGKTEPEQPQPQAADKPAEETAQTEQKVVPLAALHEERRARQQLQRQIEEDRRRQAERDAIIERRLAALVPQQQAPDPSADPVGYLDHRFKQLEQTVQPVLQTQQQIAQQQEQQRIVQALAQRVNASEQAFAAQKADYYDAIKHLDVVRVRELQAFGASEDQAITQAQQERANLALQWAHQGLHPAEVAYQIALARGYQPKAAAPNAEQRMEAQQKGVAAARSLGSGGAVTGGKLTAEALANMSDEDFSKLTDSQFRQAMGG